MRCTKTGRVVKIPKKFKDAEIPTTSTEYEDTQKEDDRL